MKSVVFNETAWLSQAIIEVSDLGEFEGALASRIDEGKERIKELKVAPVTVGPSGDSIQLDKIAEELGIRLAEGKIYERIASLLHNLAERSNLIDLLKRDWDIKVNDKVLMKPKGIAGKDYPLPSIVRSLNLYEGGRFSGLRDERETGSLNKGVMEIRGDAEFWGFSLAMVSASLVGIEIVEDGGSRLIFSHFDPIQGLTYTAGDMKFFKEVNDTLESFVHGLGLFTEDEELFRLSLLFYIYNKISSPLIPSDFSARIHGVIAAGRRFTEAYVMSIHSQEISVISKALQEIAGEEARSTAESCAELGRFIMRTRRRMPAIARELRLDALSSKLKALMKSLSEPGYAIPSELLYDLLRTMEERLWRARFIGLLAAELMKEQDLSKEAATEKALKRFYRIRELVTRISIYPKR